MADLELPVGRRDLGCLDVDGVASGFGDEGRDVALRSVGIAVGAAAKSFEVAFSYYRKRQNLLHFPNQMRTP